VYVIDPDVAIGEALLALLGTYDMRVRFFTDARQFLDAYTPNESEAGCLLVETHSANSSGLSLLRALRLQDAILPIILLANTANPNIRHEALKAGVIDVIEKPLVNLSLLARLEQVFSEQGHDQTSIRPCG
tara:strand:+ start:26686 stop:27078 length:393 start_codon:yes stop_codon:yes gene_type:complete